MDINDGINNQNDSSEKMNNTVNTDINEKEVENDGSEALQDIKKGDEEAGEVAEAKGEANEGEGEAAEEKAETTDGEEKSSEKESSSDNGGLRRSGGECKYSSTYTPPYYVPNFTSSANTISSQQDKSAKRSGGSFFAIVSVCVVLALVTGLFGGFFGGMLIGGPSSGDKVTLIKNDGSITVNEQVGSTGYSNLTVAQVADLVADSVVEITTSQVVNHAIYGQYVTSGAGSGVIVSQADNYGYIVTNYHVIEGSSEITVRLTDGSEYAAKSLGGSAEEDIAVLKIAVEEGTELTKAVFGSSSSLRQGDEVVAIGNPLGELGGTVTNGIVSALDREITISGNTMVLLQTNAAVNPGNSGGGLFNMAGELVGIVNAKEMDEGIEGLGFAIPVDTIMSSIEDIIEHGYVTGKPTLNIEVGTIYSYTGIYVVKTNNESFELYDRIISVDSKEINTKSDFNAALNSLTIGEEVEVVISRDRMTSVIKVVVMEEKPA